MVVAWRGVAWCGTETNHWWWYVWKCGFGRDSRAGWGVVLFCFCDCLCFWCSFIAFGYLFLFSVLVSVFSSLFFVVPCFVQSTHSTSPSVVLKGREMAVKTFFFSFHF